MLDPAPKLFPSNFKPVIYCDLPLLCQIFQKINIHLTQLIQSKCM